MDKTPLVYSRRFASLDYGPGHPFRGSRFTGFMELARETGFLDEVGVFEPDVATPEHLLLAHDPKYLEKVEEFAREGKRLSPDTPLEPGMPLATRRIVGGALMTGQLAIEHGLCLGFGGLHHAARNRGGGFCAYNDVAVLINWLKKQGYKRILNLDTDAHNGDGTMDIFFSDPRVLYISTHQDPSTLYPGRGFVKDIGYDDGAGFTVNLPLPMGAALKDYEMCFEEIIFPLVEQFKPDVVIRNGGSDPAFWDDLTYLGLDIDGLKYLGEQTRSLSVERDVPLADLTLSGYGGYIPEGWIAIWAGVLGLDDFKLPSAPVEEMGWRNEVEPGTARMISELKKELADYWNL